MAAPARNAVAALVAALALTAPTGALAAARHDVREYRVEQALPLEPGQDSSFTLACRTGDIASDGVWMFDNPALGPDGGLPADLVVREAATVSREAYRFGLRNEGAVPAQLHLYVTCLEATLDGPGARRRLRISDARTTATELRCPAGHVPVAPGFAAAGAGAGLTARTFPSADGRRMRLAFGGPAPRVQARCLAVQTTSAGGARSRLRLTVRSSAVDVPAGRISSFDVSCGPRQVAIVSSFALRGAGLVGLLPRGRSRTVRLAPSGAGAGAATIGALCLDESASPA